MLSIKGRSIFLMGSLALFIACTATQTPEFLRLENLKLMRVDKATYELTGSALYFNPNDIGGKLKNLELSFWMNDLAIGKLDTTLELRVAANSEFAIPIQYRFKTDEARISKDLLKALFAALLDREVTIKYKGAAKLQIARISFDIPIEHQEKVPFQKGSN